MAWRFHRPLKTQSGDRVNIGKRTSSLTMGGRGEKETTGDTSGRTAAGIGAVRDEDTASPLRAGSAGGSAPPTAADFERAMSLIARHEEWLKNLDRLAETARITAYCVREGETAGPMPLRAIVNMAALGIIDASTPVFIEGGAEWHPIEPELIATACRIDHSLYFYGSPEGLECGPYQATALRDLFRTYGLPLHTPVYRRGDGVWRTLDEFPECCDDETLRMAAEVIQRYRATTAGSERRLALLVWVALALGVALGFAIATELMP